MENELFQMVARMLGERARFYDRVWRESKELGHSDGEAFGLGANTAYESAYDILMYALEGNKEALNQFDYYGQAEN